MGTRAEDEQRRAVRRRLNAEALPGLEEACRRIEEKHAAARRQRLYYLGLAGGRR